MGGTWEKGAFTDAYNFLKSPPAETLQVIAVNLTAPILLAQTLVRELERADNPRTVLMGSTSGLLNAASAEVANTAAKFGLQGAAEVLKISLRPLGVAVTVIKPDNVATAEVEADIAEDHFDDQVPIPIQDLLATLDYLLALTSQTVPSTIALRQKRPGKHTCNTGQDHRLGAGEHLTGPAAAYEYALRNGPLSLHQVDQSVEFQNHIPLVM